MIEFYELKTVEVFFSFFSCKSGSAKPCRSPAITRARVMDDTLGRVILMQEYSRNSGLVPEPFDRHLAKGSYGHDRLCSVDSFSRALDDAFQSPL